MVKKNHTVVDFQKLHNYRQKVIGLLNIQIKNQHILRQSYVHETDVIWLTEIWLTQVDTVPRFNIQVRCDRSSN